MTIVFYYIFAFIYAQAFAQRIITPVSPIDIVTGRNGQIYTLSQSPSCSVNESTTIGLLVQLFYPDLSPLSPLWTVFFFIFKKSDFIMPLIESTLF
jgi:hypothetical protein